MKKRKRFVQGAAWMIAVLLFYGVVFTGCSVEEEKGVRVTSPTEMTWITKNPITITHENRAEEGEPPFEKLVISGLLDKGMEERINKRFEKMFAMYDDGKLPPYTGIQAELAGAKMMDRSLWWAIGYNADNVLSVTAHFEWRFQKPSRETKDGAGMIGPEEVWVSCFEPCTIDLATGEDISLKQVFCDDVDYMEVVNEFVAAELGKTRVTFEVFTLEPRAPFRGISEDQKFELAQSGGIVLILDYTTPALCGLGMGMNYVPGNMWIPFDDRIALKERFAYPERALYANVGDAAKEFLQPAWNLANEVAQTKEYEKNGVKISEKRHFYCTPSALIREDIEANTAISEELLGQLRNEKRKILGDEHDAVEVRCDAMVTVSSVGNYVNVTHDVYTSVYSVKRGEGTTDFSGSNQQLFCYREDGSRPLAIKDIFAAGADARSIIDSAAGHPVFDRILGFVLRRDGINLICQEQEPVWLTYEELGSGNLNIFE